MKKILALLAFFGVLSFGAVEAATIDTCVVSDFENSIITVSGRVEEGDGNIAVVIMPEGTVLDTGKYYSDSLGIHWAKIENNKYSASFEFHADEGKYIVKATNSEGVEFEWINKESVLEFVDKLAKEEISEKDIYDELMRHGLNLGVDVSFADDEDKEEYLIKNIKGYSTRIKENGIEGIKSIVNLTRSELEFMEKLSKSKVASSINELIEEYADSAEIDVAKYNKLSKNQKAKVCVKFVEDKYSNMTKFREDFAKEVENVEKTSSGGNGGGSSGGGSSSGLNPSMSGPTISTTTGSYEDKEIAKDMRLFEAFTDIDHVSWAWDAILYAYDNGIINGVGNNQFKPDDVLTREQFAKIITLAFGKYDENAVSDFIDVDKNNWASSYIASAKKNGLMNGISDSEFGYGKGLTRQDICVVIYRAAKNNGIIFEKQKTDFSDYEEVSDYAKEAVSYLAGNGIISGMGDGRFSPEGQATRAQAAKLIYAVLGGSL